MQGKFTYGIPIFAAEVTDSECWHSVDLVFIEQWKFSQFFDNLIVQPNEEPSLEVIFLLLQFVKINPNFKVLFITKVCHTSNLDWFLCTNTAIMMTLKLAQQVGWWAGHLILLHYHWGIIHTKISFKVFLLTNLKTPPPILSKYLCSSGLVSRQLA